MRTLCLTAILYSLIAVPAFSQVSLSTEDLDKIRLIVNDVVKEEIANSETRIKDYVNVRFDSVDKRFDSVDKRFDNVLINVLTVLINVLTVLINGSHMGSTSLMG